MLRDKISNIDIKVRKLIDLYAKTGRQKHSRFLDNMKRDLLSDYLKLSGIIDDMSMSLDGLIEEELEMKEKDANN